MTEQVRFPFELIAQLDQSLECTRLHKRIHQFNPLKILRVDKFEIRHSNILSWLLNPTENHQLDAFFIHKIISRILMKSENEDKLLKIDYLSLLQATLSDAVVRREVKTNNGRYIDIVIEIPSVQTVILIENKYYSTESVNQLKDYYDYALENYNGYHIIPIYLTLSSDIPTHNEYFVLAYHDILEIISQQLQVNQHAMVKDIYEFLTYYTDILKEELLEDEESIQLALEVYRMNQIAIDLLYVSQQRDNCKYPRFDEVNSILDNLTEEQYLILTKLYMKKKKTIDYVFSVGSNVLRQAFLTFVDNEGLHEDLYFAHIKVPNFILSEWVEYEEIIGKPDNGYWRGNGFIIWFERTWNNELKITLELGSIPQDSRVRLLETLEKQGVKIRPSAKLDGKKYTKIYTSVVEVDDWADTQKLVEGMESLSHAESFTKLLTQISMALECLESDVESIEFEEVKSISIPKGAFQQFIENYGIPDELYKSGGNICSFLVPAFRDIENLCGRTRMRWWYDSPFVYWFECLKDGRLKLILELGPLEPDRRLALIGTLEAMGLQFRPKSKRQDSSYTRLFSNSMEIHNWNDPQEVCKAMELLFNHEKNQHILSLIESLA